MEEDKIKEILDDKQEQKQQQKRTFWNNKRTVKGKALSAWLITMIAIFMLFVFGLGIFLGKEMFAKKESGNTEKQNNTETNTNTNVEPTTPVKQLETFDLANFDPSKVLNGAANVAYESKVSEVNTNFTIQGDVPTQLVGTTLNNDKKTVNVTINWKELSEIYTNLNGASMVEYNIKFDKNVRKVYVNGWGQGWGQETIFYLMEDGTVEYTPLTYKVIRGLSGSVDSFSLKSYGAVPNVEGVVILANGSEYLTDSPYGGGMSILGIKSNGEFYNISTLLYGTDAYNFS